MAKSLDDFVVWDDELDTLGTDESRQYVEPLKNADVADSSSMLTVWNVLLQKFLI